MIKTVVFILLALFMLSAPVFAEVSQEEQQRAAQRAYEASASTYNEVASTPKKVEAQVKKATSRHRNTGKGATVAVRG